MSVFASLPPSISALKSLEMQTQNGRHGHYPEILENELEGTGNVIAPLLSTDSS
jgi:hypothetical protein